MVPSKSRSPKQSSRSPTSVAPVTPLPSAILRGSVLKEFDNFLEEQDENHRALDIDAALKTAQSSIPPQIENDQTMEETHDENCDETDMRRNALHETLNAIMIGVDGARTKGTNQTYKATWKKFLGWLADAVPGHDPMIPDKNTPKYIAAYIMLQCDDIVGLKDTAGSELSCRNLSYSVANLIRSAISYQYRKEGFSTWTAYGNKWIGNPALSTIVTDYLAGLRRKKARNGDVAASMRSLTCFDLECIYDLFFNPSRRTERMNLLVEGVTQERRQQLTDHLCAELYFGYVVSFLCLLRSDETLNIEIPHCRLQINRDGKWQYLKEIAALGNVQLESLKLRLELKLPFRKTAQEGGIQPFYLPIDHDEPHLCAVRAYLRWRLFLRERSSGKMFRNYTEIDAGIPAFHGGDSVAMPSDRYLELFRSVLLDIGLEAHLYGTHSFRRGGAQYFLSERRWDLTMICNWGGWSLEFGSMTIVRYLHSIYDVPRISREDLLDKTHTLPKTCSYCGRNCPCGPAVSLRNNL